MSYTVTLYHLVFRTKYSRKAIPILNEDHLYRWIWGYIRNHGCILLRINGMPDHIHILVSIPAKYALADFVAGLKASSSSMMKGSPHLFPDFCGWGVGYYGATVSPGDKERIRQYIINQKVHHGCFTTREEMKQLAAKINDIEASLNFQQWFDDPSYDPDSDPAPPYPPTYSGG